MVILASIALAVVLSCGEDGEPRSESHPTLKAEPGVAETIKFIHNLSSANEIKLGGDAVEVSPKNPCIATFTYSPGVTSWIVDFSLINPESIEVNEEYRYVTIHATNGDEVIRQGGDDDIKRASLTFYVTESRKGSLKKVADAFGHVIRKCGGKADLF